MLRALLLFTVSLLAFGANAPKPVNDAAVESAIRAKFAKSKINEEHFKVTVRSGVALLEGRTSVPQRKGVATRLAKTGGARAVVNKIEVSEAARKQMTERLQKARESKAAAPKVAAPKAAASKVAGPKAAAPVVHAPAPAATASSEQPPQLRRMQIKP